jgi:PAS domain S-box-containing protein
VTDFYLNPEDRETFVQKLKEKGAVNDYELKLKAKDGSVIETSMSAHIIFGDDGEPNGVEGVLRDITERKRAEEALKESEEKYRDLVENLTEVIYALKPTGEVIYVSPAVKSLIGYSPKEIKGQSFASLIHEDDLPQASERINKILSGASVTGEYRIRAKSGQIRWIRTSSRPIFKEKQITGIQGILTDITESKEAERELKESEKKYRELIEKSLQGVVIIQDSRIVFANKALARITGFTVKALLSLTPERMKVLIHPEDQERVWGLLENRLIGKALPPHYECRGIRKDGSVMWMEIFAHQIIFNGKPAIQGAIIDITERKHAEEALRESEEKYKTLVETSPDAVTATDLEGKITYASQQTLNLYGYRNAKELIGKSALDLISPEEYERAKKNLKRILKEGIIKNEEYILLKKDGTRFFGELSAALVRDSEENPKMSIVTIRDIT